MSAEGEIDRFIQEQKLKIAKERQDLHQGKQLPAQSTNGYQNGDIALKENLPPKARENQHKSDEVSLPVGNYITTKEKLQKERQEEYKKFIKEKNNRSAIKRTNLEGDGMSLQIGERLSAQDRARMERNKEYNDFLKQKEGSRKKDLGPEGGAQHPATGPGNGYSNEQPSYRQLQQPPNSFNSQGNDSYNGPRQQRDSTSQTPVPRSYDDLPPRGPRKGWGTPQPYDYDDLLKRKREEELRYRRYDDVDYYQPRLKPAHSDPYLNRYDDNGRRSTRPEYYDDYDRRRVRFSDEVPAREGPPYSDRSARPRQRESFEEPIVYDWSRSRGGRSRTFTDGDRPKPALKQEDPDRPPRAKSATLNGETGLPLGQRDTGSATRKKKEQYRKELEQQMQEAKAAKQREKEIDRSPGFPGSTKPPAAAPNPSGRQSRSQVQQPPPQGYTPSFQQQPYRTQQAPQYQPTSNTPYPNQAAQYGGQDIQASSYGVGSRPYSQIAQTAQPPIGDLGLKDALARSQPELLDRPFSLNYPQPSALNQPTTNTDPYMYYGMRNPLQADPTPRTLTGKNADAFSVSSRPNKLDVNPSGPSSNQVNQAQGHPLPAHRGQRAKTPYHSPQAVDEGKQNRVHDPPFATYGAFGNPGSAGQRPSVKMVNPAQSNQVNQGRVNQGQVRFAENQPAVIPNTGLNPRQQNEIQNTFQRLVQEYKVNPSSAAASFQAIPPTQQDNMLQFLQAYSSYLKHDSASNISEPLFGLQAFRDQVKTDTIQDMASAYEIFRDYLGKNKQQDSRRVHGLSHPTAAAGSAMVTPLSNHNSPLMERYLLLQQQQQQLLQQQQQLEQQFPSSGPNQLNQQLNNPAVSKQVAAQFRGESSIKNFVGDSNLSPRSQANAPSYREQLLIQMKEKENKKNAEASARAAYEAKMEKEVEVYDPWGKGGAGAPMRDKQGKIVADLKQLHNRNETILNDPNRKDLQLYAGAGNAPPTNPASLAPGQDVSPLLAAAAASSGGGVGVGAAPGPAYGRIKGSITGAAPDPSADASRNEYQDQLRLQVEEKKRRELEEKEKIRIEEEKEQRRLEAQRERIKKEYEAELERKKQKEEIQRKQKEDMDKQLEDKRKEAENKKKEANEKRRKEAEEQLRHRDLNHNVSKLNERVTSPPIPALRTKEPERISSPPIPTLRKKDAEETTKPPPQPVQRSTQSPPIPTLQKKDKKVTEPESEERGDSTNRSQVRGSRRHSLAPEQNDNDNQKTPRKGPSRNQEGKKSRSRRPKKAQFDDEDGEISPDKNILEEDGEKRKRSRRPSKGALPDDEDGEISPDKSIPEEDGEKRKRSRRPRKGALPDDEDGEISADKSIPEEEGERRKRSRRPRKGGPSERDEETPQVKERNGDKVSSRRPDKQQPCPKQGDDPLNDIYSYAGPTGKSGSERARIFPPKDIPREHAVLDPLDKLRNPATIPEKSNHPRVIPDVNARLSPMEKLRTHYSEEPQQGTGSLLDAGLFPETKGGFEAAYKKQRYLVDWLREIDPDLVVYAAPLADNGYKTWNTIRRLKRNTLLDLCPDIKHGHVEAIMHEVSRGQTPRSKMPPVRSPDSLAEQELDIADIESSKTRPAPIRRKEKPRPLEDNGPRNGRYSGSPPGNSFVDFLVDVSKESEMYKKAQRLQNKLQRDGHMQDDDFPSERSSSPPVPAVSTKERGGPKDEKNVMGALSAMRVQLAYEQQRIQSQLDKHRDYDPYNPMPKAAHAPRRGSPQVDVFELARHKGSVAVMRNATHQAAEDFDGLKNRSGSRTRQQVKENYPNKPVSDVTLEAQQRALLRAQQEKLEEMRKGRKVTTNDIPSMRDIGRSSPAIPLDSDSAFIGIDSGETHMPKSASRPTRSSAVPSPTNSQPRKTGRSVSRLDHDDLDKIIAKSQARSDAIETLHDRDSDPDDILNKFLSKKSYDSRPPSGKSEDLSLWLKPSLGQT